MALKAFQLANNKSAKCYKYHT